eukprot:GFUD01012329.1.p1 GENE.GFUD01012329.1~~GFUD01012329.1.p1  ORF type:complete len:200 (+),score=62.30 GFUD01012329.1:52-651(+)
MPGHISCRCGEVSVHLATPSPVFRLQCGCCDCRQALQWAQLQGGPSAPEQLADLWYFQNDFSFVTGEEKTSWIKLREDGRSVRCVATCCYSTLLVHHPFYQNNVVMVMADVARMEVPHIDCAVRIYLKDLPRIKLQLLEPFAGVVIDKDNLDEKGRSAREHMQELFGRKVLNQSGTNTAEDVQLRGVKVLGLEEYEQLL